MAAQLTQIYYKDEQIKACYPFANLYFNEKLTIFFENTVIAQLVMASEAEKIAICSWRLKEKMKYYIGSPRELTPEVMNSDYQVLSFTKNTRHHQMLAAADKWHPNFKESLKKILDYFGISMPREVKTPIYQNHFSASRETYQDYVKRYLSPCMQAMSTDIELNKLAMIDSKYSTLTKDTTLHEELERKIGIPYFPMAPFLLERLFSIYCHNENIKVTWL